MGLGYIQLLLVMMNKKHLLVVMNKKPDSEMKGIVMTGQKRESVCRMQIAWSRPGDLLAIRQNAHISKSIPTENTRVLITYSVNLLQKCSHGQVLSLSQKAKVP